jgi:hypothetical protein
MLAVLIKPIQKVLDPENWTGLWGVEIYLPLTIFLEPLDK